MSDAEVLRNARMALATVIERRPYGDPLSRDCADLMTRLRECEEAHHEREDH